MWPRKKTFPGTKYLLPEYQGDKFRYNSEDDCYICPEGQTLRSNRRWYKNSTGLT
jgi:hypothetical protein